MANTAESRREIAAKYLHCNHELKSSLGIATDAALEPHPLGAGEHNENYWFADPASGRKFVLRVNVAPQPFHDDQVAYEYEALKTIEPCGHAPKPLYVDSSRKLIDHGAMVISFCEGQELDFDKLRDGDLQRCIRLMANIHAVKLDDSCKLFRPADPLRELYDECMQRYEIYRSSGFEDERINKWADRFAGTARKQMETSAPSDTSHVINTETLPSHFLLPHDVTSSELGFFVDWERPIIGEVAQDVAYFVSPTTTFWDSEYLMPLSQAHELVEDYWDAVDGRFNRKGFDERFRAWRMMTALRSTMWCCKAYAVQRMTPGSYMTPKAAQKLPIYLSDEFMERIARDCFEL